MSETHNVKNLEITSTSILRELLSEKPLDNNKEDEVKDISSIEVASSVPEDTDENLIKDYVEKVNTSTSVAPSMTVAEVTKNDEDEVKNDTISTEEIKMELSDFTTFKENDTRKRKGCKDEENVNLILDVFLRSMYPLNENMDKTITVGVFKSLNFKSAVLLNQSGKTSLMFTVEMWDIFIKYVSIIEAYLYNNLTGKKTAIGFENSNLEIDNIRLRGSQYVRVRDLSKHNKKILLTCEEFHVLSNLAPAINRYIQQLTTHSLIIFDYLNSSINVNPAIPLIYGPIDPSIYNRLPQEVSFYRRTTFFYGRQQSEKAKHEISTATEHKANNTFDNMENGKVQNDGNTKTENIVT